MIRVSMTRVSDGRAIAIAVVEAALHLHESEVSGALHEVLLSMPSVHSALSRTVAVTSAQKSCVVGRFDHEAEDEMTKEQRRE